MLKSKFLPDYSKPTTEVYKHLTREIIKRHNNLSIICASQPSNTIQSDLPSWVPDWSSPSSHLFLAQAPFDISSYCQTPSNITFSRDLSTLKVEGRSIATIGSTGPTFEPTGSTLSSWLKDVKNWRTLIADWDNSSRPFVFDDFYQLYSSNVLDVEPSYPTNLAEGGRKKVKQRSKKNVMRFQTHMNAVCWNRRLAVIKRDWVKKEEEGLVPAKAVVGDQIVVLYGCRVPVVLRKSGEAWTFVGDAFVSGWKDRGALWGKAEVFSIQ
jgi:hypothetical protein